MSNYQQKYLKYKNKYIQLKNEIDGGGGFAAVAASRGFNHGSHSSHTSHSRPRTTYDNKSYLTSSPEVKQQMSDYAIFLCKKNNDDCNDEQTINYYISYAYYQGNLRIYNNELEKYNSELEKYNNHIKNYQEKLPIIAEEWDNKIIPIKDFFKNYHEEKEKFDNRKISDQEEYKKCTERDLRTRFNDKFAGNSVICKKVDESNFMTIIEYFKKLKDDGKINEEQFKNASDLYNRLIDKPLTIEEYILSLKKPVEPAKFTQFEPVKPTNIPSTN